ncbi:PaaI family thioesterase [Wenzhouxiangella sp. XN201]|uniref:PaaI family thioesterase n=1 Tax=Wenzhouxiangella sp. XN201 TaxID=2710755 RepID=UPI0013C72CA4|nr:PaaI family thioesterase [Wenzhouxiangella sp. XN201]NEZ02991.1 PaaI family thioesterase [Wenzhouxiangella sp. XN201]
MEQSTIDMARRILQAQPFSQLLGTRLNRFEPGRAELELELDERLLQQHGFAHGGVVSYLADNALTFAGGSVLGDSLTSEFKVHYLRPARGRRLIARAEVVSSGRRQAVCQCAVYACDDEGERQVALAVGTILPVAGARRDGKD